MAFFEPKPKMKKVVAKAPSPHRSFFKADNAFHPATPAATPTRKLGPATLRALAASRKRKNTTRKNRPATPQTKKPTLRTPRRRRH